jgi:hypothetical protein
MWYLAFLQRVNVRFNAISAAPIPALVRSAQREKASE